MNNLKILLLILLISSVIYTLFHINDFDFTGNAEKIYEQGLEFSKKRDYQNAYYNFSKIPRFSKIYKYALFRKAMVSYSLCDYDSAIKNYLTFIKEFPDTILTPKATYNLAICYYRDGQYINCEKTFKLIQKKYAKTDFAKASDFYLGVINTKINKKNEELSLNYFLNYLEQSPKGRLTQSVLSSIKELKIDINNKQKEIIGIACYKNGNYKEAISYLNNIKSDKTWAYLVSSLFKTGNNKKAYEIFQSKVKVSNKNIIDDEIFYETIENYVLSFSDRNKLSIWLNLYKLLEPNNYYICDYVLYNISINSNNKVKQQYFNKIYKDFKTGNFASEALWEIFWYYFTNGNYEKAKQYGKEHLANYSNTKASPKILFWMGKLSLIKGDANSAHNYFKEVQSKYPNDYYAYRANRQMNKSFKIVNRLPNEKIEPQFPINYANLLSEDMNIVMKIMELNDYELLEQIHFDSKFVDSWIHYKLGNYSKSANLARTAYEDLNVKPLFYDEVYKLIYPLHYNKQINENSLKLGLNPYVVLSIMREESFFNPQAKSIVGALGLMQVMPQTARYISSRNAICYTSLFNPDDNIKLGTNYLRYVLGETNNYILAVASYNAGPNIVKEWKNSSLVNDIDFIVENIPYFETKHYVRKVFGSYWNYINIYK